MARVQKLKNPLMMNPPMMHLISDIPEPAAYGANDLTSFAAENENNPWVAKSSAQTPIRGSAVRTAKKMYAMYRKGSMPPQFLHSVHASPSPETSAQQNF